MLISIFKRVFFLIILTIVQIKALKFEYENGIIWKIRTNSSEQVLNVEKLRKEFPELLFWSGHNAPSPETHSYIVSSPSTIESQLLHQFRQYGLHVEEYEDSTMYLITGHKEIESMILLNPIEDQEESHDKMPNPSTSPLLTKTYVNHIGKLKLDIQISDFEYDVPADEKLNEYKTQVDIIQTMTIPNNSSATVVISLSEAKTLIQSFTISFTESLSIGGTGSINLNVPDIGIGGSLGLTVTVDLSSTQTIQIEEDNTYSISKSITILPYTTIKSHGYVNWLKNVEIPFKATATIIPSLDKTNNAAGASPGSRPPNNNNNVTPNPRLYYCPDGSLWNNCYYNCGRLPCPPSCVNENSCLCCFYEINEKNLRNPFLIRDYLISNGETNFEITGSDHNGRLQILFTGELSGSFGLDAVFEVEDVNLNLNQDSDKISV